jgi:hypothetical protein
LLGARGTSDRFTTTRLGQNEDMGIVLLLLILALLFGGVGLFVEGLKWLLIIAVVLLIAGAITGSRGRSRV